ncbi:CbtA family protein [Streptomyces sp. NPDC086549]|uniref:CbtA family protein n=1 Tax=Streptomyces sp. NPDC086549 TaxID=3365752 RepID=UPI003821FD49
MPLTPGAPHTRELRSLRSTAGRATGVLVYGVAFGGIAALAFCFALGRVGRFSLRATALLLSGLVLVTGLAYAFLPVVNEVPKDFPATLLWRFRLSAPAIQTVLWGGFGLLFGELAERLLHPKPATSGSGRAVPAAH